MRLNSPSRSQELHSRLLEKPSSLHASDDSSAPYADSCRGEGEDDIDPERSKIKRQSFYEVHSTHIQKCVHKKSITTEIRNTDCTINS